MGEILPPNFAGLAWVQSGDRFQADATEKFWTVYRVAKQRLFQIGIRIEKMGDDRWIVLFTPRFSKPNVQQLVDGIVTEADALERLLADQRREADERRARADAERIQAAARVAEIHMQIIAERLAPAVEVVRRTLSKFGEFTHRKDRVRQLIEHFDDPDTVHLIDINDLLLLEECARATNSKSSRMLDKIRSLQQADVVDWSDDEVVEAVVTLTLDDSDHATVEDSRGWNRPDSPAGHWAYAILHEGTDARASAIKLARTMVGKYASTHLGREAA